ncbi:MAG: hypothetical protein WA160_01570 [Pseudobdellovibrio sp.]
MKVIFQIIILFGLNLFAEDNMSLASLGSICSALKCSTLSNQQESTLASLMLKCETQPRDSKCVELEKSFSSTEQKNKIASCERNRICLSLSMQITSSCAIGGVNAAADFVVEIIKTPYSVSKFVMDSFAQDKDCFENKNNQKEELINSFDIGLPNEHSSYGIPSEIKFAMKKNWSCREIRHYLQNKDHKYQEFLGPLVAKGMYKAQDINSPLGDAILKIKSELDVRLQCYTAEARAELNCAILTSAIAFVAGGAGLKVALSGFTNLGISTSKISNLEKVLQKTKSSKQTFITTNEISNPQMEIWKLIEENKVLQAASTEEKLISNLKSGKIISSKSTAIGAFGAQFVELDNGMKAVWKPTKAIIRDSIVTPRAAAHEVAAFEIDKALGNNTVPITILKDFKGEPGSLQILMTNLDDTKFIEYPKNYAFFDDLIANADRHSENVLSLSGRPIAIDHGLAFKGDGRKNFIRGIENEVNSYQAAKTSEKKIKVLLRIKALLPSRDVYEKLYTTKVTDWKKILNPYLNSDEINRFLERRNAIITLVEKKRAELGDQIFPDGNNSPLMRKSNKEIDK